MTIMDPADEWDAEAAANLAKIPGRIAADFYREKASQIFKTSQELVTPEQRAYAKITYYHEIYHAKPVSFAEWLRRRKLNKEKTTP